MEWKAEKCLFLVVFQIRKIIKIREVTSRSLTKCLKNTTFGKTHLNINYRIKHDWRNSRFNRLYHVRKIHLPRHGDVHGSPFVPSFAGFFPFPLGHWPSPHKTLQKTHKYNFSKSPILVFCSISFMEHIYNDF